MPRIFLMLLPMVLPVAASCQDWYNDPHHYPGAILTKDKQVYRCELFYKQSDEKLFCSIHDEQLIFEAADIEYFQFYDINKLFNRYFFSFLTEKGFKLFELLLKGDISLYRKSYVSNDDIEHRATTTIVYMGRKVKYQLYYKYNGIIHKLTNFEKEVLPLMKDNVTTISNYIIDNKLDLNEYVDQLSVIDYYNQSVLK